MINGKRLYFLQIGILVLVCVGLLVGAQFIAGLLTKESAKLVDAKARIAALQKEQGQLSKAKQDIKEYTELYNIARTVVPQSKDQAQAVRQIDLLARANGVAIESITFPSSTLGSGSAPAAGAGAAAKPAGPSAAAGSPTLSQLKPVPTIPGVYNLQLIVTSSTSDLVRFNQLINFLSDLERNRLTALVSTISIAPGGGQSGTAGATLSSFAFTLTLDIYIKPGK
jgi:hypothetical protein